MRLSLGDRDAMKNHTLKKYHIVLASASPRRRFLLDGLGLTFEVQAPAVEESYPSHLTREQIPLFLAERKALAYPVTRLEKDVLVIAADTIVWLDGENLGKPEDHDTAVSMLQKLSGKKHEVITGVCLRTAKKMTSFFDVTAVYFKKLVDEDIEYYVSHYRPYDKAGAYGAQEWIGYVGITSVEGSYFNVMGLPVHRLYEELMQFQAFP
jgi:septum formation protein